MMEVIKITDDIRKIIETDKSINNIEPELKKQNIIPIIDDGIIKALKGLITLEDCFNSIDE